MRKLIFAIIVLIALIGIAKASIIVPPDPDPAHLVLWYRFDEANNTYVIDYSGHGNNGTVYGSPQLVPGRYGYALSFDGVDDYINLPSNPSLVSTFNNHSFTVTMWVYFFDNDAADKGLLSFGSGNIDTGLHLVRRNLKPYFGFYADDLIGKTNLYADKWWFLAFTWNNTTRERCIYVNGVLDSKDISSGYLHMPASISWHFIGQYVGNYMHGIIDEVRIYNTSLTADQIREMYEALRVKFYDEETLKPISTANVTIFNANYTISVPVDTVVKAAVLFQNQVPQWGKYQIKISATNYSLRYYTADLESGKLAEVNAYLPPASKSILLSFKVVDYTGIFYSPDTTLVLYKPINGTSTIVFEKPLDVQYQCEAYVVSGDQYVVGLRNSQETRVLGYVSSSVPDTITLYIKQGLQFKPIQTVSVLYNITNNNGTITIEYQTMKGNTSAVTVQIYNSTGALVYNITTNTPNGKIVYIGSPNETYTIHFIAQNDFEPVTVKVTLSNSIAISINVQIIKQLPEWFRMMFFGGLCLFVALLFKRSHVPVGLLLSFSLAAVFTAMGILPLGQSLLWVLAIIVGLSFFVWWRDRR